MKLETLRFPKGFLWGAGTSAHQVEGNNKGNDWWQWENSAQRIEDLKIAGENPEEFVSGIACDHYHRYEEDLDLAKKMNNNAYRFSIEWSRIEPEKGEFNQDEIEHYRNVIRASRKRGLEPFVTLHHFTNPRWFTEKGCWLNNRAVDYFADYVEKVVTELKDEVNFWVTLNEPIVYITASFLWGDWPPQRKNPLVAWNVLQKMIKSHRKAYRLIHEINPEAKAGIGKSVRFIQAYNRFSPVDRVLAGAMDYFWNRLFLDRVKEEGDFIGLNYYLHDLMSAVPPFGRIGNRKKTDIGWEIYPEGIYHLIRSLSRYNKPIYILENGLADGDDSRRKNFILNHLRWIHKAIDDDLDVRGYFYWSLLDNFEWALGFKPRFGLVEVDYKTLRRKPRPSSRVYAKICRNNSI